MTVCIMYTRTEKKKNQNTIKQTKKKSSAQTRNI